jgi:hypothetical protein
LNSAAVRQTLGTFNCPSHPNAVGFPWAGHGVYVQCLGSNASWFPNRAPYDTTAVNPNLQYANGVFYLLSDTRFADIVDGLSNTAAYSEIKKGPYPAMGAVSLAVTPATSPFDFRVATNVGSFAVPDYLVPPAACENRGSSAWQYRGLQYYRGIVVSTFYTHTLTPNARLRDCILSSLNAAHLAPRSFHPGGVNELACDGSVRFVSDTVDLNTWRAVGTRAMGDIVGDY